MRKLFYLLLALPLAFAACTEKPAPEPAPDPQPDPKPDPKPEYVMDMAFAAAARIPSADVDLDDTYYQLCFVDDAELYEFSLLLSGEDAVLTAGEYEPESADLHNIETEALVEFAEGNVTVGLEGDIYSFEMVLADAEGALYRFTYKGTVLDMEPAEKPEPQVFNPVKVVAYRDQDWELGNFELDLYINDELYHSLDMQDMVNPNDGYLTAGVYSMAEGAISEWSNFVWDIETGEGAYITDAEITITHFEDGTTNLKGYFESEYGDHLNIDWTGVVNGFTFGGETPEPPTPGEDIVFNATFFGGEYYAPEGDVTTHNYYFVLSDVVVDGDYAVEGATYFYFDLYNTEFNESITIPNGVYTFDPTDSCDNLTAGASYTYGFYVQDSETAIWYMPTSGTVTVSDNKIVAEFVLEDGRKATVTYEGNISLGNTGGNEGGNGISTLEGDLELNETGWIHLAQYYGDYYTADTDNWFVEVYEDPYTGNGGYLLLDLLVDPANDDWRGTYTLLTDLSDAKGKFVAGGVDEDGYMLGCWYAELADGGIGGAMAPIADGTITITAGANGAMTIAYDCVDDNGNKITGSVTADAYAGGYSAKALNAQAKKSQVSVKKQKIDFRR
ncbi:MAG: hypothetical protein IIW97_00140 [Alistipes sp.]|nr:hypothetical protein [Alistipes sp.]